MRSRCSLLLVSCIIAAKASGGCVAENPSYDPDRDARADSTAPRPDAARFQDAAAPPPDLASDAPAIDAGGGCATPVIGAGSGLLAEYFDNADLTGTRVARTDATIDFQWQGVPDQQIGADTFSVRWTGKLLAPYSGLYTLHLQHNDGARLFLDGRVVLYHWGPHLDATTTVTVMLEAGRRHDLRLEVYDNTGTAIARLSWAHACQPRQIIPATQLFPLPPDPPTCLPEAPAGTGTGLRGQYFGDGELVGVLAQRMDPRIDFAWGSAAPVPAITSDTFSVRWTGQLESPITGPLTLYLSTDDVGRAWLDGAPLLDNWSESGAPHESAITIDDVAGRRHDLRVEMVDRGGGASARLSWSWPCRDREVVPTTRLYPPPP